MTQRLQDLVILIPGITGSVLVDTETDRKVWDLSGGALSNWLFSQGQSLQRLKLAKTKAGESAPDDGIHAADLLQGFHGILGLWKIDGYREIQREILSKFRIEGGGSQPTNFIKFPYDWRRSNRETASSLKVLIDRSLHEWRLFSHWKDAKAIILAHSMGGLAAHYFLEVLQGWKDTRALVTFGTPFLGSVDPIDYVANGYKNKFANFSEVVRSFPSVYELMAPYEVFKVNGEWKKISEIESLPAEFDPERVADATAFHDEIASAIALNKNSDDYHKTPYMIVPFVGVNQDTKQSVELNSAKLIVREDVAPQAVDPILGGGDGRVPRVSASPLQIFGEFRETFFSERHGSLQTNSLLLDDLSERLKQMQAKKLVRGNFDVRSKVRSAAISLNVEDLYLIEEPIMITARVLNYYKSIELVVDVKNVTEASIAKSFVMLANESISRLDLGLLQPGRYRVTVSAKEGPLIASPVRDVFEVEGGT